MKCSGEDGGRGGVGCEFFLDLPVLRYPHGIRSAAPVMRQDLLPPVRPRRVRRYAEMGKDPRYADSKELLSRRGPPDLCGGGKDAVPFDEFEKFDNIGAFRKENQK